MEKAAIGQLVQHADYCDLSPQYQSAYKKNHSCETSLLRLVSDSLWAMEQQQATIVVITDWQHVTWSTMTFYCLF